MWDSFLLSLGMRYSRHKTHTEARWRVAMINAPAWIHNHVSESISHSPKYFLPPFRQMFPLLFPDLNTTESMGTTCWQTCLQFRTLLSNPLMISEENCSNSKSCYVQHFTASCQFLRTKCWQRLQTYNAGKQKAKPQQTWSEPVSALQHTASYKITTHQHSKHRMLIEINYSLRGFYFFLVLNNSE